MPKHSSNVYIIWHIENSCPNYLQIIIQIRVRLPPHPIASSSQDESASSIAHYTEGEEIEVFSRASDQESCGWWRAVIKMIKGDFHVVEYLGWETTYTEVSKPCSRLEP